VNEVKAGLVSKNLKGNEGKRAFYQQANTVYLPFAPVLFPTFALK
jgi:hypothetical protein